MTLIKFLLPGLVSLGLITLVGLSIIGQNSEVFVIGAIVGAFIQFWLQSFFPFVVKVLDTIFD